MSWGLLCAGCLVRTEGVKKKRTCVLCLHRDNSNAWEKQTRGGEPYLGESVKGKNSAGKK